MKNLQGFAPRENVSHPVEAVFGTGQLGEDSDNSWVQTSLRLRAGTKKEAKVYAVSHGVTMQELLHRFQIGLRRAEVSSRTVC